MKNGVLFGLLLSLFGASASASEWNNFVTGTDEGEYFFDASTVVKTKDVVTLWVKVVQKNKADSWGSWASANNWRMNCSKRTIQTLGWSAYEADGKFLKSNSISTSEDSIIPDSIGEGIMKVVCTTDFPKNSPATKNLYFKIDDNDVFAATKRFIEAKKSRIDNAPQ